MSDKSDQFERIRLFYELYMLYVSEIGKYLLLHVRTSRMRAYFKERRKADVHLLELLCNTVDLHLKHSTSELQSGDRISG